MKLVELPISPKKRVIDPQVIKRIEEALAMAKDGHVANFVFVSVSDDNTLSSCWGNDKYPFLILGALENVKQEFMDAEIERR